MILPHFGGFGGVRSRKMGVNDLILYMAQTHLSYHIFSITIFAKKKIVSFINIFIYCVFRMLKKTAEKLSKYLDVLVVESLKRK